VLICIDTFRCFIFNYSHMYLDTTVRQGGERETRTVPAPENHGMERDYHYDYRAPPMRGRKC